MLKSCKKTLGLLTWLLLLSVSGRELDQIIQDGVLKAAVTDTQSAPFVTLNSEKKFVGFEIDFLHTCAKEMGVKLQLVPVKTYDDLITALVDGKADIAMSKLSRTSERMLKVSFTRPYVKAHLSLIVNRTAMLHMRGEKSMENYLRRYDGPLSVQLGTSHYRGIKKYFPMAKVCGFKGMNEIDSGIQKQSLFAYIDDQISTRSVMKRNPGAYVFFQRVILEDTFDNICVAIQPHCPRLWLFMNCLLEQNMHIINRAVEHVL